MSGSQLVLLGGAPAVAANYIEDVFSTYLYTGTAATITINNGIDLSGNGGLVWLKSRSSAAQHALLDSARGITNGALRTDGTGISNGATILDSLNNNGFTINEIGWSYSNTNGTTYASWTFRKAEKFFDVVTYTGTGSAQNIAHNLGSVPGCIIVKAYSGTNAQFYSWTVYHRSLTSNLYYMRLNETSEEAPGANIWNSTTPTSTQFTVGSDSEVNASGRSYVAYVFAHDAGGFGADGTENVITCGSYTGNGSTTGPSVTLGYEPQWVMIKRSAAPSGSGTAGWVISDNMRGLSQTNDGVLSANNSNAEVGLVAVQATATGFQIATTNPNWNVSGDTYIYIAIRRGPMKTPEAGTEVFTPVAYTGTRQANATMPSGIVDDSVWTRFRTLAAPFDALDRIRGKGGALLTNSGAEENAQERFDWATMDGVINLVDQTGGTSYSFIDYHFKRAPKFYDIVCYSGNATNRTVTHNLGAVPELMIVKIRNGSANWMVYNSTVGNTKHLRLNQNIASITDSTTWNNTSPTSSVFSLGTDPSVNDTGYNYVAYLFASVTGVSKVGSYTGTGTTQQINCGFTGGARFVLIKRTDSTGDWYVWDSARGIVAGNDPYLLINSSAVEVTNTDYVDTYAQGFEISSTAPAAINANGGTFIFLAIA